MFRFHPETKEMYLDALFPGFTVDDIRADIPWDLKVADTSATSHSHRRGDLLFA